MKRTQKSATALTIILSATLFAPTCAASDNGSWYSLAKALSSMVTGGVIAKLAIDLWLSSQKTLAASRKQAPGSDAEFEHFLQANLPTTEEISPEVEAWILAQRPNALGKSFRIFLHTNNSPGIYAAAETFTLPFRKKFPQANTTFGVSFSPYIHHAIQTHVTQEDQGYNHEDIEVARAIFQHEYAHLIHRHGFTQEEREQRTIDFQRLAALTFLCSGKHSALTSLATLTGIKIGLSMLELFLRRRLEEQADDCIQTEQGGRKLFTMLIENRNAWADRISRASAGTLSPEFCRQVANLQDLQHPSPDARLARLEARFAKQRAKSYIEELRGARFTQVGKNIYVPQGFCKSTEKSHLDPELELC